MAIAKTTISENVISPVSTTELRDWCRIDPQLDEELLIGLADAAVATIEQQTGRAIGSRIVEYEFSLDEGPRFTIPATPVIQILSAGIRSEDGTTTPLVNNPPDSIQYNEKITDNAATVYVPSAANLPCDMSVVITVELGYANSATVPAPLRHAIAVFVGASYAEREGDVEKAMKTIASLIAPYRLNVL